MTDEDRDEARASAENTTDSKWWFVTRRPMGDDGSQVKVTIAGEHGRPYYQGWGIRLESADDTIHALSSYTGLLVNAKDSYTLSIESPGTRHVRQGFSNFTEGWAGRCTGAGTRYHACGELADYVEADGMAPTLCSLCAPQRRHVL